MSKKNFAILVFCLAFGVNALAFLFSKKTFHEVEDVKNVWIYELPRTASPFDAYSAVDMGPHQGVIGTLFLPNEAGGASVKQMELALSWNWSEQKKILVIQLKKQLKYGDGSPLLASHWANASQWIQGKLSGNHWSPEWEAWIQAKISAPADDQLIYDFSSSKGKATFDFQRLATEILTHPLTGVIHPLNLEQLKKGESITKDWISSGPYKIWKWNPKEIILASRNDFPVMLPKEFFRNVKFQSAPIKNPSCDFIQATAAEEKTYTEHFFIPVKETLHVFWMCRSWAEPNTFCSNPADRAAFAQSIAQNQSPANQSLAGKKVRYRIPQGSDSFRALIRQQIEKTVQQAGGTVEEVSYFFHNSKDSDLELGFVVRPLGESIQIAQNLLKLSSRLSGATAYSSAEAVPDVVGQIAEFPVGVLMKNMRGDVYDKVFLNPDIEDQKLPQ